MNSLVLFSEHPFDAIFADSMAKTLGLKLEKLSDATVFATRIKQDQETVALVDISSEMLFRSFETAINNVFERNLAQINLDRIHYVSSSNTEDLSYITRSPLISHQINRTNELSPELMGGLYGRVLKEAARQVPMNTGMNCIRFTNSTQKTQGLEKVRELLVANGFMDRQANAVVTAVDELLMNAMYGAPVDETGKQSLKNTPRDQSIPLNAQHQVELFVCFDGDFVKMTVADSLGTLDRTALLSHLYKPFKEADPLLAEGFSGGVGLRSVFQSGGSLCYWVLPFVRTEATVIFRRTDNYRDFRSQSRFVFTHITKG